MKNPGHNNESEYNRICPECGYDDCISQSFAFAGYKCPDCHTEYGVHKSNGVKEVFPKE